MTAATAIHDDGEMTLPDPANLRIWAEREGDRPIVAMSRISAGSSRALYLLERLDADAWVMRLDTGGGPIAGTELTLEREASLYRALADQPVLIPRFKGIHPSGKAFLMTLAAGTHDLAPLTEQDRVAVCDAFLDALADVHNIDPASLDLPAFRPVLGPRDHALNELDVWQRIMEERLNGDLSLGSAAFALLRQLAPEYHGRIVLCHGDVGPKNFLFEDGRITGLIDWEHAHFGDPMDDLAWWIFRGHEWLGVAGELSDQLKRWSARSGIAIDAPRLRYYRTLVLLRWYIEIRAGLNNGGSTHDRAPYLRLIPAIDIKLAHALAQLLGADLGSPPRMTAPQAPFGQEAIAAMRADLTDHILPALSDPEASRRARSALEFLAHLEAVGRFGQTIDAEDRSSESDLPSVFQGGQPDWDILAAAAAGGGAGRTAFIAFLDCAMRRGARHAHLWPETMARAFDMRWIDGTLRVA